MKRFLLVLALLLSAGAAEAQYTISPSPFLTAFDNSGRIINGACVWTYLAGTTTAATTYTTSSGTSNTNPIQADSAGRFTAFLQPGVAYKFVYEARCVPPAHATVLRTADNISAMPTSSASVDITATAGETISALQCAYLSDGGGGKTSGSWFKCDSANTYSSTSPFVGIAPSAIASGTSGTVRISGEVTGFGGLAAGSVYYAGSVGSLTTTPPALARALGQATGATSLVLEGNPPQQIAGDNGVNDFRLTLTSGTPVTTADVTAASTIYLAPYKGNRITLYDSVGNPTTVTSAQTSIAVPATTVTMYDVFAYLSSGAVTLEVLAWSNDTTRATAIVQTTTGAYTKSGDLTRRYLGSFRTASVSGQTEDSVAKRFLWNYYHRVRRQMKVADATASWSYNTATTRQANGAAGNKVEFVVGVAEVSVSGWYSATVTNDQASVQPMQIGIGLDTTTAYSNFQQGQVIATGPTAGEQLTGTVHYEGYPAVGYHYAAALEKGTGAGNSTWYGTATYPGSATLLAWYEG